MKGVAGVSAIVVVMAGIAVAVIRMTAASSAPPPPLAYGFNGSSGWQDGTVKPRTIAFGAGGSLFLRGLRWSDWGQTAAEGQGIRWADNCRPDCASGAYLKSKATLVLSGIKVHDGFRYFSRLTMRWTASGRKYAVTFHWAPGALRGAPPFWN
jgi:hypothetical protein